MNMEESSQSVSERTSFSISSVDLSPSNTSCNIDRSSNSVFYSVPSNEYDKTQCYSTHIYNYFRIFFQFFNIFFQKNIRTNKNMA